MCSCKVRVKQVTKILMAGIFMFQFHSEPVLADAEVKTLKIHTYHGAGASSPVEGEVQEAQGHVFGSIQVEKEGKALADSDEVPREELPIEEE